MAPTAVLPCTETSARSRETSPGRRVPAPHPTELDARGPTQPKPLVAILAALEAIPPGTPQYVRTAEQPVGLLRELGIRGVEVDSRQLPDGSWQTLLLRGDPEYLRR